jgi:hypothetical protein
VVATGRVVRERTVLVGAVVVGVGASVAVGGAGAGAVAWGVTAGRVQRMGFMGVLMVTGDVAGGGAGGGAGEGAGEVDMRGVIRGRYPMWLSSCRS